METSSHPTISEYLAVVEDGLQSIENLRPLLSNKQLLELISNATTLSGRFQALAVTLLNQAEQSQATRDVHGTDTRTWLADTQLLTRGQAGAMLHQGKDLQRFPALAEAFRNGDASPQQTNAVTTTLRKLPDDLPASTEREAEEMMVQYCARFDSHQLSRLSRHLLEVVAPEVVDETEAKRLERELRIAQHNRHLNFIPDGHGSTLIKGSLPTLDAELLQAQVAALAAQRHRTMLDARDPLAQTLTPEMGRADALVELARQAAVHGDAPRNGGDRPRIVVTINHERLLTDCARASLLDSGTEITAGELRMLACDAEILPAVMGGPSEILDLGKARRLVSPQQRVALHLRDGGCMFPGCDAPPNWCEAHHLVPWQRGGPTDLNNLALFCKTHHQLIEPDPHTPPEQQWQAEMGEHGYCQIIPPTRVDPKQKPVLHPRHHHK